jgi:general nucleoside transport system permease protein
MDAIEAFLQATVRTATPLMFAALGELAVQRAGLINIGLEGIIIAGAFGALAGAASGGQLAGFLAAAATGLLVATIFALFTVFLRANQIVTGTAITLLGLGATGTLYRATFGMPGSEVTIAPGIVALPWGSELPVIGPAVFAQPPITYLLVVVVPLLWFVLYRSHFGLALRAVGENPEAALAAGIRPRMVQVAAILFSGMMGGLAGGALVIAQVGSFAEGMSAGRGFIAIAIVALGRWHPLGVTLAALLFGATTALQFLLQAMGWSLPYQLFLALPYALTLITLTLSRGRFAAPAALAGATAD